MLKKTLASALLSTFCCASMTLDTLDLDNLELTVNVRNGTVCIENNLNDLPQYTNLSVVPNRNEISSTAGQFLTFINQSLDSFFFMVCNTSREDYVNGNASYNQEVDQENFLNNNKFMNNDFNQENFSSSVFLTQSDLSELEDKNYFSNTLFPVSQSEISPTTINPLEPVTPQSAQTENNSNKNETIVLSHPTSYKRQKITKKQNCHKKPKSNSRDAGVEPSRKKKARPYYVTDYSTKSFINETPTTMKQKVNHPSHTKRTAIDFLYYVPLDEQSQWYDLAGQPPRERSTRQVP